MTTGFAEWRDSNAQGGSQPHDRQPDQRVPVIDEERALIGVLTEFDLIRAIHAGKSLDAVRVDEIMTSDAVIVGPEDTMDEVIEVVEQHRVLRVLVVRDGELLGIISRGDIFRAVLASTTGG